MQGKLPHEDIQNRGTGDDDVGSFWVESWYLAAALERYISEQGDYLPQLGIESAHHRAAAVVSGSAVPRYLPDSRSFPNFRRPGRCDRYIAHAACAWRGGVHTGRGHHTGAAPPPHTVSEKLRCQPDRPELERPEVALVVLGTDNHFRAATTNVEEECLSLARDAHRWPHPGR